MSALANKSEDTTVDRMVRFMELIIITALVKYRALDGFNPIIIYTRLVLFIDIWLLPLKPVAPSYISCSDYDSII